MATQVRVALETGPKGRKVVAVTPDCSSLERGGKSKEATLSFLKVRNSTLIKEYEGVGSEDGR